MKILAKFGLGLLAVALGFVGYYLYQSYSFTNTGFKLANFIDVKDDKYIRVHRNDKNNITIILSGNDHIIISKQYFGKRTLNSNTLYVNGLTPTEFNEFISKNAEMNSFKEIQQLVVEKSEFSQNDFDKILNFTDLNKVSVEIYDCKINDNFMPFLNYLNSKVTKWLIERINFNDHFFSKRITKSDFDVLMEKGVFCTSNQINAGSESKDTNNTPVSDPNLPKAN